MVGEAAGLLQVAVVDPFLAQSSRNADTGDRLAS